MPLALFLLLSSVCNFISHMALCRRFARVCRSLQGHARHAVAVSFSDQTPAASKTPPSVRYLLAGYSNFNYEYCNSGSQFDRNLHFRTLNLAQSLHYSTLANSGSGPGNGNDGKKEVSSSASWIDLYLPKKVQPYARLARLDKPIGTWLLVWPCVWSITMAAAPGTLPDVKTMALFGSGALLLRGAGCTINDLLDRDIDTKVERTRLRPVASGDLTPFKGLCFLGLQLLLGLGILVQLNTFSLFLRLFGQLQKGPLDTVFHKWNIKNYLLNLKWKGKIY